MTFELRQTEIFDRCSPNLPRKLAVLPGAPIVRRWWQRRETEEALQWLSDRELADVGVERHEIRAVALSQAPIDAMPAKRRAR